MTKRALVEQIRKDTGLTTVAAEAAVDQVFTALERVLRDREIPITVPGFGTFRRRFRDRTNRRNPRTGDPIIIEPRHVVTFKEAKPKR